MYICKNVYDVSNSFFLFLYANYRTTLRGSKLSPQFLVNTFFLHTLYHVQPAMRDPVTAMMDKIQEIVPSLPQVNFLSFTDNFCSKYCFGDPF